MEEVVFKPSADYGNLHATKSKMHEKSPDYFGEIAIDPKDLTNVRVENGLLIYKLGGWKLQAKSGKTYLSLKVDRFIPVPQGVAKTQISDDEVPF
jgi:hypothetical protein